VELTAYQLTSAPKEKRPPSGEFNFRMGQATVVLEFHSEGARIDLNAASKEFLSSLFVVLGAKPADADEYADRIVAWRTGGESQSAPDDTESDAYRLAGRTYKPRRAPFQNVGELWLVLGLPPAMVERAMPYVTVFNGKPEINILDAPAMVIAALPGVGAQQVNAVLAARRSTTDGQAVLEALGQVKGGATIEGGRAVRVTVNIKFDSGGRSSAEIVMLVNDDVDEPYRVLSWRDDFDQIMPTPARDRMP
jgi:general secretion pathway protein K